MIRNWKSLGFWCAGGWGRWKRCLVDVLKVYHNGMMFEVIHGELLEGGLVLVMVHVKNNESVTKFRLRPVVFDKDRIAYV